MTLTTQPCVSVTIMALASIRGAHVSLDQIALVRLAWRAVVTRTMSGKYWTHGMIYNSRGLNLG